MVCIELLQSKTVKNNVKLYHEMLTTINGAYFLLLCYIVNL